MGTVAARAARLCARRGTTAPPSAIPPAGRGGCKPAWRRAPRTEAALKTKRAAIEAAVSVLESANIPYSQQLPGKLVVPPPVGITGLTVTFWPARARLRIQRRPTKREQDIGAFEQALVAQGHRIPGYPSRETESRAMMWLERARASQERLFLQRAADLAEMEQAYDELAERHRQRLQDLAAGGRIRRRDPRSIKVRRRFQQALNRAMRGSVDD